MVCLRVAQDSQAPAAAIIAREAIGGWLAARSMQACRHGATAAPQARGARNANGAAEARPVTFAICHRKAAAAPAIDQRCAGS